MRGKGRYARVLAVLGLGAVLSGVPAPARSEAPGPLRLGVGVRSEEGLRVARELASGGPFAIRIPVLWSEPEGVVRERLRLTRIAAEDLGWTVTLSLRFQPGEDVASRLDVAEFARWVSLVAGALSDVRNIRFEVTNRSNAPTADDQSDAGQAAAVDAIVRGVMAAKAANSRAQAGFSWLATGLLPADVAWWSRLGRAATPEFVRAVDFVGVQLYPGSFSVAAPSTAQSMAAWTAQTLTQARGLLLPMAGLTPEVAMAVGEFGFPVTQKPTPLYGGVNDVDAALRTEGAQARALAEIVTGVQEARSSAGVVEAVWWEATDDSVCSTQLCWGLMSGEGRRRAAFDEFLLQRVVVADGT